MDRRIEKLSQDQVSPALSVSSQRWIWISFFVFLGAGVLFAAAKFRAPTIESQSVEQPLDGKLIIYVRTSDRGAEPIPVEKTGALPVRAGGIMSLEANFTQPARAFFVWIDCDGKILPLYPWNDDTIEVTDINQPPPARTGAKVIYSPPIGGGWNFGKKGGMETVLLLARREPFDSSVSLGSLFDLPPPQMRHTEELVGFQVNRGDAAVSNLYANHRGTDEGTREADEKLKALMLRLRDHFEMVRVVRFTHEVLQTENK